MIYLKRLIRLNKMFDAEAILQEVNFKAIKSSGAGGQHVNKTASKVELAFDVQNSEVLTEAQKELLKSNLQTRLSKTFVLIMQCGESRSQHKNKTIISQRFVELIRDNLIEDKERIPTKIPRAVVKKRLTNKRRNSEKKANRKPPEIQ
ncbi:alternative ribosome rescue aminoacyl-tRNA hydrolase ArfB [Psychroserpens sp. SPM9]|uniref:alternative ribosome rescue aminoacyl-tRNA hydrolase ArfB n=1 Tax=Psychroserpens sp. SPM9 TaxID=2975598 RepID=UPI0021A6DC98|nr:alternative ribosome rescue aminoacyl-tRNA hydrolase ArfB [Psychroserpens sp. SPM9]MDG5490416.1 alternative ribosome rescue aminoacyl-tRNA hydrolase ArfB [Psychroserpens sp. SPM9]